MGGAEHKIKLGHLSLENQWRGGERQCLYLMQALHKIYVQHLVVQKDPPLAAYAHEIDSVEIHPIHKPYTFFCRLFQSCDLWIAHDAQALSVLAWTKRIHHRPFIAIRRLLNPPHSNIVSRWKYNQCRKVVAISPAVRGSLLQWGLPASAVVLIPDMHPLKDNRIASQVQGLKRRFGSYDYVVGYVGALAPEKNVQLLVRVAAQLPDTLFVFVGDGEDREVLKALGRKLGARNLVWEGFQQDPYSYYDCFDCLVLPSHQEALGSVVLDSFFYRVPVLVSQACGINAWMTDGQELLMFSGNDEHHLMMQLKKLKSNPDLSSRLIQAAFNQLRNVFAQEKVKRQYQELLEAVLSSKSGLRRDISHISLNQG